jgi:hypothetical protein
MTVITRVSALVVLVCAAAGLLAACAAAGQRPTGPDTATASAGPSSSAEAVNLVPPNYRGRFRVAATVLEGAGHGPQLCQAVQESYPPRCGGPDVVGWSWQELAHESASGTRWGSYLMVGTFDGTRFTPTEPARPAAAGANPGPGAAPPDFTSPCPTPAGGWRPVDPGRATSAAFERANALASASPDFAGLWIDQNVPARASAGANDPMRFVLNVRYIRDLPGHEAELRRVWGGALCVSSARRTEAELRAIQDEQVKRPGVLTAAVDVVSNRVDLGVWVAESTRQADLDATYGPGSVRLVGALEPLD